MRRIAIVAAVLLVAACSNMAYENGGSGASRASSSGTAPATYTVRSGDTLTAIAFRYGLDARDVARWNNLRNPDRIEVGQRLVLRAPTGSRSAATSTGSGSRPASTGTTASAVRPAVAEPAWRWPTRGNLVARFGGQGSLSTGIGIAGSLGQEIVATAAGRVVYSGSGLADYGQLIIIEHNEAWLSAYGHNQRVLVSQGQSVVAGQKIAEMGPGPGGTPRLHFEIRRNGDPLDPVPRLPVR
ncbi:MAG TPA: peptidoglycan DD-metalloendopeptidase family protein [Rhodanobacteraceae bacterium]|nr:peptidoglycan DD-metalloendopeptidase family protein [Rhodanobacteraceae bacterium]